MGEEGGQVVELAVAQGWPERPCAEASEVCRAEFFRLVDAEWKR